jgi:hypothetical protein
MVTRFDDRRLPCSATEANRRHTPPAVYVETIQRAHLPSPLAGEGPGVRGSCSRMWLRVGHARFNKHVVCQRQFIHSIGRYLVLFVAPNEP